MDSFDQTTRFRYSPVTNPDDNTEFSGILEIYVHHARNIHNICIYDDQDVYTKFSLTYNPDETISTRIINGGGKNPDFNDHLAIKVNQCDAVLKCEMWMLSRAKHFMDDQLLGFAVVPISMIVEKGKITQDFSLSSTDLFHSPAGTVKLSLSLNTSMPLKYPSPSSSPNNSITSEVVLLDRKTSEVSLDPLEYSRVEFPDVNAVRENQQMVSEYFSLAGPGSAARLGSFLRMGAFSDDYDMGVNSSEDNGGGSVNSPNGSIQNSGFFSSTLTSLSEDRNLLDLMGKKDHLAADLLNSSNASMMAEETNQSPDTPTSKNGNEIDQERTDHQHGNVGIEEAEDSESAMQQQIVDMYMRSMQQFTESLARMKLPSTMDLDSKPAAEEAEGEVHHGDVIQRPNNNLDVDNNNNKKKKDGSRVFYGSRAFF